MKLDILKQALGLVAGLGVGKIVSDIVVNNVTSENKYHKVIVFAGKTGISMVVSAAIQNRIDANVDEAAAWVNSNILIN